MKRIKKIVIVILSVLIILNLSILIMFSYLKMKGEANLKESETIEREGTYITYQGKEYRYKEDTINILVMGIDKSGGIEEEVAPGVQGLADFIVLVSLDTSNNTLKMFAIPRDTMTQIQRVDSTGNFYDKITDKLTLQYGYGNNVQDSCELMRATVSNIMFRIPIQRYVSIDMDAVPILNDAVGGVDVISPELVQRNGTVYFEEGEQVHLEGKKALNFIQVRDVNQNGSAMGRLNRQKIYIEQFFNQAKQAVKNDITLPITLYNILTPYMYTNLSLDDVTYLGTELLEINFSMNDLIQIPGEAVFDENYHGGRTVYNINDSELQKVIIENFYEPVKESTDE